jgi:hypothetical protein
MTSWWDKEQEKQNIPLVERTYKVRKPNGEIVEVNRFGMNLTMCAQPDRYIQCSDTSWLQAKRLEIIA